MLDVGLTKYIQEANVASMYGLGRDFFCMLRKTMNTTIDNSRTSHVCAHKPLDNVLTNGVANANIIVNNKLIVWFEKILKVKKIIATVAAVKPVDNIFCIFISLSIE